MQDYRAIETPLTSSSAHVSELWGDSPFFPGPSWVLAWPLDAAEQEHLNNALSTGQLWERLQCRFAPLAALPDPWKSPTGPGKDLLTTALEAIAALARALLQPAPLEPCKACVPVKLKSVCLVLRSDQHELAGRALRIAAELIRTAWLLQQGKSVSHQTLLQALKGLQRNVHTCCDHPLTAAQLAEARSRGIPAFLIDPTQRLYQLGTGIHSRWISSTSNDHDSAFGVAIASHKGRTSDLLRQLGLPVPKEIRLPADVSNEQLLAASAQIGYPCVLKPLDGEQGRGVTANIIAEAELLVASKKAKTVTKAGLLLQTHVRGDDYRLNVVNGELAFVVRRTPPAITGNGQSTVMELIEADNVLRRKLLAQGEIAAEIQPNDPEVLSCLEKSRLDISGVPADGQYVLLRRSANLSTGGLREELDPSVVHPSIVKQCLGIARTMRLEVCGIDYLTTDIGKPAKSSGGVYLEVNSMPQNVKSRAGMIMTSLFSGQQQYSIKSFVVIGNWSAPAAASELQSLLSPLLGSHHPATIAVPVSLAAFVWPLLNLEQQDFGRIYEHPREVLLDHTTGCAIFLTSPELVLNRGLPVLCNLRVLVGNSAKKLMLNEAWQRLIASTVLDNSSDIHPCNLVVR